jgi:hypothetical protein
VFCTCIRSYLTCHDSETVIGFIEESLFYKQHFTETINYVKERIIVEENQRNSFGKTIGSSLLAQNLTPNGSMKSRLNRLPELTIKLVTLQYVLHTSTY